MTTLKPYLPAVIWLVIILVLSGYSGNQLPKVALWQIDKLAHIIMYGTLSFFLIISFSKQFLEKGNRFKIGLRIVLFGVFYGGFMEILQNNIFINRSGNWADFIANTIGAVLGVLIAPLVFEILPINRWLKIK